MFESAAESRGEGRGRGHEANQGNSSPTMARCSAAKAQKIAETNFMAPGEPNPQVTYGPVDGAAALQAGG